MITPVRWFYPSFGGDFEVIAEGTDKTKLIVKEPTAAELAMLAKALRVARRRGWIAETAGIAEIGISELLLNAPLRDVCREIAKEVVPRQGALTALRSEGGVVTATLGIELPDPAPAPPEPTDEPTAVEPAVAADEPQLPVLAQEEVVATTVKKPTHCCPYNQPGRMERAERVLRHFCTPAQLDEWDAEGTMTVLGHLSGHRYRVHHRHHPDAVRRGKIVYDLDDRDILHLWDWTVPPEEEALAMKLFLEHAEPAVRNNSSCLGNFDCVFNNPFPGVSQGGDGTDSAAFLGNIGGGFIGFFRVLGTISSGIWRQ